MPQESKSKFFTSPGKSLRGLKALVSNGSSNGMDALSYADQEMPAESINDDELALRKAEEAGIKQFS